MAAASALALTLPLLLLRSAPLFVAVPFLGWGGRLLLLAGGVALLGPLLVPVALGQLAAPLDVARLGPLFLHELCVGLMLLLGAMLPWAILRGAGRILDALRKESLPEGPLPALCGLLALCLFFGGGGAALVAAGLAQSYAVAPLPALSASGAVAFGLELSPRIAIGLSGQLFALSLSLALPLVGAWLCALLGLGLFQRFVSASLRLPIATELAVPGAAPLHALPAIVELVVLVAGLTALVHSWQAELRTLPYLSL